MTNPAARVFYDLKLRYCSLEMEQYIFWYLMIDIESDNF